ncbi:MAG: hypothetical protein ACK4K4_05210, partial [Caldimicrobium sp.]
MKVRNSLAKKIQNSILIGLVVLFSIILILYFFATKLLSNKMIHEHLEREKLLLGEYINSQAKKAMSEVLAIKTDSKIIEIY